MNDLKFLEEKAKEIVKSVENSPEGRYEARVAFYQKYGDPLIKGKEGLGHSELAFIKWEMRRGVLNPMDGDNPGSPWWRAVNGYFMYLATLAQLIDESGVSYTAIPVATNFWLEYIKNPNEQTWYKAHNSSIIAGYEKANELAFRESNYEQYFMNIVLYRLLYAQSMVEGVSFGILGKIFGNPRGDAVTIITDIEAFYPSHYPLSKEDIAYVTHHAHNLMGVIEDIFDKFFILPQLDKLYKEASQWTASKVVLTYVKNNKPIYPLKETTKSEKHFTNELTPYTIDQ